MSSNLSKIKTKFRTTGRVSGNFGKNKVVAGSNKEIGYSDKDVIRVTTQDEYLNRLYVAFDNTESPKLRDFLYQEIRNILSQRGVW